MYVTGGSGQPIVIDSGPAGGNSTGQGLSELNVTARCTSPPCAAQGSGVDGTIVQFQDAVSANSTGYHYLAFSANALGGGLIEYGAGGTASALPFNFRINGTSYAFPFAVGGIVGPATTVSGNLVCWNNLVGTLVSDCGYAAGTSGNAVAKLNGNNTWSGTNTYSAATTLNGNVTVGGSSNFSFTGSSSGTTRVIPTAVASGTLTLPAATDTLVGKATTDTLTNKTFNTAGTGNSFSINGTAVTAVTGTGNVAVLSVSPSLTTPTLGVATATSVNGVAITATSGATLQLGTSAQLTLGNSKVVTFSQSMAFTGSSPGTITMPNGDGTLVYGGSQVANSLGSDVLLNNTGLYFEGPRVTNGNTGTWFASGTVVLGDSGGAASFNCKLWDGTTVFASASTNVPSSARTVSLTLSGFLASPAADIRISCNDQTAVTGGILFNQSGNSKDSTLTAYRVL